MRNFAVAQKTCCITVCLMARLQLENSCFQVNTSGEENKGGVQPDEVVEVTKHIIEKCPNIVFQGLMTIGALAHSVAREPTVGPNPDFLTLLDCKK